MTHYLSWRSLPCPRDVAMVGRVLERGGLEMAVSIRQLHPLFVGEVGGIDLRQPLS